MKTWPLIKNTVSIAAVLYTGLSLTGRLSPAPRVMAPAVAAALQPAVAATAPAPQPAAAPAGVKPDPNQLNQDDLKVYVNGDETLQVLFVKVLCERPVTIRKVTINNEFSPTRLFAGLNDFGVYVESDNEFQPKAFTLGERVGFVFWGDKANRPYQVKKEGPNYNKSVVKVTVDTDRGILTYKL